MKSTTSEIEIWQNFFNDQLKEKLDKAFAEYEKGDQ